MGTAKQYSHAIGPEGSEPRERTRRIFIRLRDVHKRNCLDHDRLIEILRSSPAAVRSGLKAGPRSGRQAMFYEMCLIKSRYPERDPFYPNQRIIYFNAVMIV